MAATVDFGGGPLVRAGPGDIFTAKLDPKGAHVWSRRFGDASLEVGRGLAIETRRRPAHGRTHTSEVLPSSAEQRCVAKKSSAGQGSVARHAQPLLPAGQLSGRQRCSSFPPPRIHSQYSVAMAQNRSPQPNIPAGAVHPPPPMGTPAIAAAQAFSWTSPSQPQRGSGSALHESGIATQVPRAVSHLVSWQ